MTEPALESSSIGDELELFSLARNWKDYIFRQIQPYLGERVLENGAGIGTTLCRSQHRSWVCVEPDATQVTRIQALIDERRLPAFCEATQGRLQADSAYRGFDAVLYVAVLEHTEDDRAELLRAAACLAPGGHLVILAPAHQFLFTPFDKRIGHYRRYDRASLGRVLPPHGSIVRDRYLDSVGMLASASNRHLLHSGTPSPG